MEDILSTTNFFRFVGEFFSRFPSTKQAIPCKLFNYSRFFHILLHLYVIIVSFSS